MSPRRLTLIPLLVAAIALTGCASLSEKECRVADWYDIGVRDGAAGYGQERVIEHAKACSEVGVAPDRVRWAMGREAGLERYCTADRGLWVGRNGGAYGGVCGPDTEDAFLSGYRLGQEIAGVRGRIDALTTDIDRLDDELEDEKLSKGERRRIRVLLVGYELERRELLARYDDLEASAAQL